MSVASFHFRKSCILKSVQPTPAVRPVSSFTDDNLSTSWSNSPLFLESGSSWPYIQESATGPFYVLNRSVSVFSFRVRIDFFSFPDLKYLSNFNVLKMPVVNDKKEVVAECSISWMQQRQVCVCVCVCVCMGARPCFWTHPHNFIIQYFHTPNLLGRSGEAQQRCSCD